MSRSFEDNPFGFDGSGFDASGAGGSRDPNRQGAGRSDRSEPAAGGGEPVHQPPNPADLLSHPPATTECARVRGMLRDFVDRDLDAERQAEVENHAHTCRQCALALARVEYEVFRLRAGFHGSWAPIEPRPGFARRTLSRLLAETSTDRRVTDRRVTADGDPVAAAALPVSARAKSIVAAAVAAEAAAKQAESAATRRRAARSIAFAVSFGVLFCAVAFGLVWQSATDLEAAVRLSIVSATDAWRQAGVQRRLLTAGDGIEDGGMIVVEPNGAVGMHWHDASITAHQPAAEIVVEGEGEVHLTGGLVHLTRGSIQVSSQRPMTVLVGDGSRVVLGAGEYHLSATEQSSAFDALAALSSDLAVRVEVLDGEAAMITREGGRGDMVAAGQVGRFTNAFGGIALDNLPSPTAIASARGREQAPPEVPEPAPDLVGLVLDEHGGPVAGSQVTLRYLTADGLRPSPPLLTNAAGRFELPPGSALRGGFAVVEVVPPGTYLGFAVPEAVRVAVGGANAAASYQLPTTQLQAVPSTVGQVVDGAGAPLADAVVVPVLYDEILGLVQPWPSRQATADQHGQFLLHGLPRSLPAHQVLGLLALHPSRDVRFQPIALPGSAAASVPIRVALPSLRTVAVRGLPPSASLEIYEELSGLPANAGGIGMRRHVVASTAAGEAAGLRIGAGRLWLRAGSPQAPTLRRITWGHGSNEPYWVESSSRPYAEVFREPAAAMIPMLSVSVDEDIRISGEQRLDSYRTLGNSTMLQVIAADAGIPVPIPDAQVFALTPRGCGCFSGRFLGLQDGDGIPLDLDSTEVEVVAMVNGMIGYVDRSQFNTAGSKTLRVAATGSVQFENDALLQDRPVLVTLTPRSRGAAGARPPLYRFATRGDAVVSGLPAGDYDLVMDTGASCTVTVAPGQTVAAYPH